MGELRVVLDTNVLISRLLIPQSLPGQAVRHIMERAQLLVSYATLTELADVLSRSKFDAYVSIEDRKEFFRRLTHVAEIVPVVTAVRVCRDTKDDKFLELAVDGRASFIVTGDKDLLELSAFRAVGIITAAQALGMPDDAFARTREG